MQNKLCLLKPHLPSSPTSLFLDSSCFSACPLHNPGLELIRIPAALFVSMLLRRNRIPFESLGEYGIRRSPVCSEKLSKVAYSLTALLHTVYSMYISYREEKLESKNSKLQPDTEKMPKRNLGAGTCPVLQQFCLLSGLPMAMVVLNYFLDGIL